MNNLNELLERWMLLQETIGGLRADAGSGSWLAVNLSMAQLKIALILAYSGGMPNRTIAAQLRVGASAVTPLVDRLVALKLARREPDSLDRRVVYVRPTAKTMALRDSLLQTGRATLADILKDIPAAERQCVSRALAVLSESALRVRSRVMTTATVKSRRRT